MTNDPTEKPRDDDAPPDIGGMEVDEHAARQWLATLESEQNFVGGVLVGLVGAIIGAAAWAVVTVLTQLEFGLMAIVVGFLAGIGVRIGGKGFENKYGVAGAVLALFGCLAGKVLTIAILLAKMANASFVDVLFALLTNPNALVEVMIKTFHPLDIVFYAIALYEGYKFAFRTVTEDELRQLLKSSGKPKK